MAKLTNTTIYGTANITGTVVASGPNFDISAASGINISSGNSISSVVLANTGLNYQTVPAVLFSNTTTGGITANANALMKITSTFTVGNVGASYANGDYLYANSANSLANALFQVTSNTDTTYGTGGINGLSLINAGLFFTMPSYYNSSGVLNTGDPRWIQITGTSGVGAGANVNVASGGIQVSNAYFQTTGSGYVEQPTVTFSGGTPITAASGYAAVGSTTIIRSLGGAGFGSLEFYTPASLTNNAPVLRLRDVNTQTTTSTGFIQIQNNNGYTQVVAQGPTDTHLCLASSGVGRINLNTNGTGETTQMRVSHTASAVNFVQVTGAATGVGSPTAAPTISAQGSDANVWLALAGKGTSGVGVQYYQRIGTSYTNYLQLTGAATGIGPAVQSGGNDPNVDIQFQTKGTGSVNVGTANIVQSGISTNKTIVRNQAKGAYANLDNISVSVNTAGYPLVSTVTGTQALFWSWERLGGSLTGGSYTGSTVTTTPISIGINSALTSGGDTAIVNIYEQTGVNFYRVTCTQMVTAGNASIIIERIA